MVGKVLIGNGITRYDCDADVLLLSIEQVGEVACHTGARSCFYDQGPSPSAGGPGADPPPADTCTELMRVIEARRDRPEPGSYTKTPARSPARRPIWCSICRWPWPTTA